MTTTKREGTETTFLEGTDHGGAASGLGPVACAVEGVKETLGYAAETVLSHVPGTAEHTVRKAVEGVAVSSNEPRPPTSTQSRGEGQDGSPSNVCTDENDKGHPSENLKKSTSSCDGHPTGRARRDAALMAGDHIDDVNRVAPREETGQPYWT